MVFGSELRGISLVCWRSFSFSFEWFDMNQRGMDRWKSRSTDDWRRFSFGSLPSIEGWPTWKCSSLCSICSGRSFLLKSFSSWMISFSIRPYFLYPRRQKENYLPSVSPVFRANEEFDNISSYIKLDIYTFVCRNITAISPAFRHV